MQNWQEDLYFWPGAKGEGFLLILSGYHAPAFFVTHNFYVLKRYNCSDRAAIKALQDGTPQFISVAPEDL